MAQDREKEFEDALSAAMAGVTIANTGSPVNPQDAPQKPSKRRTRVPLHNPSYEALLAFLRRVNFTAQPADPVFLKKVSQSHSLKKAGWAPFNPKVVITANTDHSHRYVLTKKSALYAGKPDMFTQQDAMVLAELIALHPDAARKGVTLSGTDAEQALLKQALDTVNLKLDAKITVYGYAAPAPAAATAPNSAPVPTHSPSHSPISLPEAIKQKAPISPKDDLDFNMEAGLASLDRPVKNEPAPESQPASFKGGSRTLPTIAQPSGRYAGMTARPMPDAKTASVTPSFERVVHVPKDDLVAEAAVYVSKHHDATQKGLMDEFGVSRDDAKEILQELETEGVVSEPLPHGATEMRKPILN